MKINVKSIGEGENSNTADANMVRASSLLTLISLRFL